MARSKVKLEHIADPAARKACFRNRKKGLLKKIRELSTLCDIQACAIIHSPYESQIDVWPSTLGVQRVLAQFNKMEPAQSQKKMLDQESFIRERISKERERLSKQVKHNREKEMTEFMYHCLAGNQCPQNLALPDLHGLGWTIDKKLREINEKLASLKLSHPSSSSKPAFRPTEGGFGTVNEE